MGAYRENTASLRLQNIMELLSEVKLLERDEPFIKWNIKKMTIRVIFGLPHLLHFTMVDVFLIIYFYSLMLGT